MCNLGIILVVWVLLDEYPHTVPPFAPSHSSSHRATLASYDIAPLLSKKDEN